MNHFRLVVHRGAHAQHEWVLPYERAVLLGRRDGRNEVPDVDLTFDRHVSRRHARIWFERETWWLEDLGSRHGTRIGRQSATAGQPIRLDPGVDIRVGETGLSLFPPNWHQLRGADTVLDLVLDRAIDPAQTGARRDVISRLRIQNAGASALARVLTLRFGTQCIGRVAVPPLTNGESRFLPNPNFEFSGVTASRRRWHPLVVEIDGKSLICGDSIGSWFLGWDEWSLLPEHRCHLAGFVSPGDPEVSRALGEATVGLSQDAPTTEVLRRIYDWLAATWSIDYRLEPMALAGAVRGDPPAQRVRSPHRILANWERRSGVGTCLDLALLIASMLEAFHRLPLVAIVDRTGCSHALVGCWKTPQRGLEPVLSDPTRLLADAHWIDPNGCTRDPEQRADLREAEARAVADLASGLEFALDVAAARADGVHARVGTSRP